VIVEEIDVPGLELSTATVYTIIAGEARAYHSRWWPERAEDYGADVRRKLEAAAGLSADDYVQAGRSARTDRRVGRGRAGAGRRDRDAHRTLDPAAGGAEGGRLRRPAAADHGRWRLQSVHRRIQPLGWAGDLSPLWTDADGMPSGLQIASAPGRDGLVLRLAAAYEHNGGNT
jgi:aspartyl-tRNA(Asn)/glutamyl-tRNA(Gln) amidotransferase subunit A